MSFCINCGEKLVDGAKFCHSCGTPINNSVQETQNQRKQEFVGKILKCPNCGAVITETTAICPECGAKITGREATMSIKAFKEQLMEIESKRKKGSFADVLSQSANPVDSQKLSLIGSFPIPNTVDDIQEFIMLAIANIDVKLSKNSLAGNYMNLMNSGNINKDMQKKISDAWVLKMQQAYKKAEIMFPDDNTFKVIQSMYVDKMKKLKLDI